MICGDNTNDMNPQPKLSICIFSDANFLAINILENLLSRHCVVNVVTEDVDGWKIKTSHLSAVNKFSIIDRNFFDSGVVCDYSIFCGGFIDTISAYREFYVFNSLPSLINSKRLILFPIDVYDRNQLDKIKISDNTPSFFWGIYLGQGSILKATF